MPDYIYILIADYLMFITANLVLSALIISLERRNPTAALAWLFFMTMLPGIGFFFYLLLSQNIARRKIFKYTEDVNLELSSYLNEQRLAFKEGRFHFINPLIADHMDHILFHNRQSDSFFTQNNDVTIYTDGQEKFDALFKDIAAATHHIHICYFIIKEDQLSRALFDLLIQKSEAGVEVRVLIDHIGSRQLRHKTIRQLRTKGIDVVFFFPSKLKYFNYKSNYRNHRKIVVIDGLIGYVGGFNIGNEYLGLRKKFGYWRDTHLRMTGDAVTGLQLRFALDWRTASRQDIPILPNYVNQSVGKGHVGLQIVTSGPDNINEQIKQGFIKMILSARDYIYIQSPYFIPDESILEALRIAAATGVDVRLMIPNKPDHPFVYWATYSYVGELLDHSIRTFIYDKGFLHAKTIVVDDMLSSVGTCNFDIRSFRLNFEVNAFMYDEDMGKELRHIFEKDLDDCFELTPELYNQRSLNIKAKEAISRLFSPVL